MGNVHDIFIMHHCIRKAELGSFSVFFKLFVEVDIFSQSLISIYSLFLLSLLHHRHNLVGDEAGEQGLSEC